MAKKRDLGDILGEMGKAAKSAWDLLTSAGEIIEEHEDEFEDESDEDESEGD